MSELEQLRRENAELRQQLGEVKRIVFARGWKPAQRVTALANQLTLWDEGDHYNAPVTTLAQQTGLSADTVSTSLQSLQKAGLVEWHSERVALAADGSEAGRGLPAVRFETASTMFALPLPDELPESLPEAARTRQKREKQAAARAALAALATLPCPHCGTVGDLHAACGSCGERVHPDDYRDPDLGSSQIGEAAPDLGSVQIDPATDSTKGGGEPGAVPLPPDLGTSQMDTDRSGFFRPDLGSVQIGEFDVKGWLLKRIGQDRRMIRQLNHGGDKYQEIRHFHLPDYVQGKAHHVYGSRPRLADGTTWLLSFDFDHVGPGAAIEAARALAKAGASPIYWGRGNGGHLELYFDQPVNAEAARAWCERLAPTLAASDECYPCLGVAERWKDCTHQGESWPLVRLEGPLGEGGRVVSCPMFAFAPREQSWLSVGWLGGPDEQARILKALAICVTPAAIIPAPQAESAPPSPPLSASRSPSPRPDSSTVKAAIRWFNENNSPTALGLPESGYFRVRADDRTPSCCWDKAGLERGEWIAFDYGSRIKHDLFDVWTLCKGLDKAQEIARLCEEYRYHVAEQSARDDASAELGAEAEAGPKGGKTLSALFGPPDPDAGLPEWQAWAEILSEGEQRGGWGNNALQL